MGAIRLVNKNQLLYSFAQHVLALNGSAPAASTTLRWQPTSTKIMAVFPMPFSGFVTGLIMRVAAVGINGNSADYKAIWRVRNGGSDLAGAGIGGSPITLTDDLIPHDVVGGILSPAGTRLVVGDKSGQAINLLGDLMYVEYVEAGTIGTGTRPIMIPVGVVGRAAGNIDPRDISNKT